MADHVMHWARAELQKTKINHEQFVRSRDIFPFEGRSLRGFDTTWVTFHFLDPEDIWTHSVLLEQFNCGAPESLLAGLFARTKQGRT